MLRADRIRKPLGAGKAADSISRPMVKNTLVFFLLFATVCTRGRYFSMIKQHSLSPLHLWMSCFIGRLVEGKGQDEFNTTALLVLSLVVKSCNRAGGQISR